MVHFDDKALGNTPEESKKIMSQRQKSGLSVIFEVMDIQWGIRIGCLKKLSLEWSSVDCEFVQVHADYFGRDCELESVQFGLRFSFDHIGQVSEHQLLIAFPDVKEVG